MHTNRIVAAACALASTIGCSRRQPAPVSELPAVESTATSSATPSSHAPEAASAPDGIQAARSADETCCLQSLIGKAALPGDVAAISIAPDGKIESRNALRDTLAVAATSAREER
jgi:hypothetical protein